MCNCKRDAEDCVGAELRLVRGAVQVKHGLVDRTLVGGLHAQNLGGNFVEDCVDCVEHTLTHVAVLVAVTALVGLKSAGRGARRDGCARKRAILKLYFHLDSGVTTGVENFTCSNSFDAGHLFSL